MIEHKAHLIGIMPKKGSGQLDNGRKWEHDYIELHCLMPLDTTKGGIGSGGQIIKLDKVSDWLDIAKESVGQEVTLISTLITDGKGGQSALKVTGIKPHKLKANA